MTKKLSPTDEFIEEIRKGRNITEKDLNILVGPNAAGFDNPGRDILVGPGGNNYGQGIFGRKQRPKCVNLEESKQNPPQDE